MEIEEDFELIEWWYVHHPLVPPCAYIQWENMIEE